MPSLGDGNSDVKGRQVLLVDLGEARICVIDEESTALSCSQPNSEPSWPQNGPAYAASVA